MNEFENKNEENSEDIEEKNEKSNENSLEKDAVTEGKDENANIPSSKAYGDPYNEESNSVKEIKDYKPIDYTKIKKEPIGSGVKAFALIMAVIILMTASCAVGYIVRGNRRSKGNNKTQTILNLEDKPDSSNVYTTAEVYDLVNKSVVGITAYNSKGEGSVASGVIYTEDGYVITNDHIYDGILGAKFKIRTYDNKTYDARFVAGDSRSDLAVLKIDANGFYPAVFGNSQQLTVGETVVAVGRPSGIDENSITRGVVSLKERRVSVNTKYSMRLIQTDSPINPGNSGGALVNMYGQVIGITSSKLGGTKYEGIGFAIPTTVGKSIVESLIQNGCVNDRAKLGISYKEINEVMKEINGYKTTGVLIAEVNPDSDLYGKIEVGDILTSVNGVDITGDNIVLEAIESSKPGDTVEFTVLKANGNTVKVSAKLLADKGTSSYKSELTVPAE